MLDTHQPWAAQLGTPEPGWQRPRSAIERTHHLAGAATRVGGEYDAAAALLDRRARLVDYFRKWPT